MASFPMAIAGVAMYVPCCKSCAPRSRISDLAFVSHAGLTTLQPSGTSGFAGTALRSPLRPGRVAETAISTTTMSLFPKSLRNAFDVGCRALSVAALAAVLAITAVDPAHAARGGGRVGGSSFRAPSAPSRSYAPPRSTAPAGAYGGYGYGGYGGSFFGPSIMYSPMLLPVGGSLGTGFGTLVLTGAAAAFIYQKVAERAEENEYEDTVNPESAVVTLKVGLLSTARALQLDLDMVGRSADTSTVRGLRYVLEEAVLALLRNPDYWVYGSVDSNSIRLSKAEDLFNRRCMEERLKLTEETLTNVAGRRKENSVSSSRADPTSPPAEYIVVTLVCAAASDLASQLPKEVNSVADLRQALGALGGVSVDSLQGIEVIWAPQALKDTLTEQEMLADHPELRMI